MNLSCRRCQRVITVPDIPLPQGYTQKCGSCGYDNPVDPSEGDSNDPFGGNPQNFNAAVDQLFSQPQPQPQPQAQPAAKPKSRKPAQAQPQVDLRELAETVRKQVSADFEAKIDSLKQKIRELEANTHADTLPPGATGRSMQIPLGQLPESTSSLELETRNNVEFGEVLICTQSSGIISACEAQLVKLGYRIQPVPNLETAKKLIEAKDFHIVILDQKFLKGEEGKLIMLHFKQQHLPIRRCQIVILISNLPSRESQVFYQWGLDMNINEKDIDQIGTFVQELNMLREKMLSPFLKAPSE